MTDIYTFYLGRIMNFSPTWWDYTFFVGAPLVLMMYVDAINGKLLKENPDGKASHEWTKRQARQLYTGAVLIVGYFFVLWAPHAEMYNLLGHGHGEMTWYIMMGIFVLFVFISSWQPIFLLVYYPLLYIFLNTYRFTF